jgi:hypothetical protein
VRVAAKTARKPKTLGPVQKQKIWKSFKQLELKIKQHKNLLALLSVTSGGKP